ncbi:MAG: hypothetical protein ABSH49_07040 [Bryobacteraceae bacterium]
MARRASHRLDRAAALNLGGVGAIHQSLRDGAQAVTLAGYVTRFARRTVLRISSLRRR